MEVSSAKVSIYYSTRVPNMRQRGGEWRSPCPIHRGKRESFAVNSETGLWKCHSKCGKGGNILNLEMELTGADFKTAAAEVARIVGRPESARRNGSKRKKGGLGPVVAEYNYTDEAGKLLFQCIRYTPKDFRQRRPDGKGGYVWNLSKVRLVPYHLPQLLSADTVYVVEGEKDVQSLESLGLAATCNPQGAGKWRDEYAQYLKGKNVVILPDQDEPGELHAASVARCLTPVAASVQVVNLPSGKDVTDWIASGGTLEQLLDVARRTPPFQVRTEDILVAPAGSLQKPHRSDTGNAERFIAKYGDVIRYVPALKAWLLWSANDGRWVFDDLGHINKLAVEFTKSMLLEAAKIEDRQERNDAFKHASASQNIGRLVAMIRIAASLVAIRPSELDRDRYLLNCLNGTLDLRTGELRPPCKEDMLTKRCPVVYDPNARLDQWDRFLDTALHGDQELMNFLQRVVGYTLTGDTREEKLFFVHGEGGTGKSTFIEAVKMVLGDYSRTADFKTFLEKSFANGGAASGDVARLCGCRLVSAIETNANKNLDIGLVKALTGRDTVTARFLYKGEFEFQPEFKLWLIANDAPVVPDDDDAAWRRLVRIPFENVITAQQRNPALKAMLTDPTVAGPAILAWAVRGCLEWQRHGLRVPSAIERAIHEYRGSMDPLKDFFAEKCSFADGVSVGSSELYNAYLAWADRTAKRREQIIGHNAFVMRLTKRGCKRAEIRGLRMLVGVGLLTDQQEAF